jgi:trehalose 6-phosphate phosphatase
MIDIPALDRAAFLLDLDGTLLDLAPKPDLVVVPDGLIAALHRLRARLGDALAVVTGRPIEQVDALLGDAPYAVAGEHGGAVRHHPGAAIVRPDLPDPPADWLPRAEALAARHPGALVEPKRRGLVVHYRLAPDAGPALRQALDGIIGDTPGFDITPASMAWEVRPHGADKGLAVRDLMRAPPFAGRLPVFIGDDVTDLDGIAVARELGGAGLHVPETFGSPDRVRAWLAALAEGRG